MRKKHNKHHGNKPLSYIYKSHKESIPTEITAKNKNLIIKLGLQDFIQVFSTYFARIYTPHTQNIYSNDTDLLHTSSNDSILYNTIKLFHILHVPSAQKMITLLHELESYPPLHLPPINVLDNEILKLAKGGVLSLKDIFECMQMVKFFYDLHIRKDISEGFLRTYCDSFTFPKEIVDLLEIFDFSKNKNTEFLHRDIADSVVKIDIDSELHSYYQSLESKIKEKQNELYATLNRANLQEYLVDKQLHFIDNTFCLLVRAGFSHVLQARVINRSAHGFFYITPLSLDNLQTQIYVLEDKIQARLFALAKEYSKILSRHIQFLAFINKEYDYIDSVVARLQFARDYNLEFVMPVESSSYVATINEDIILHEYSHPSLKNPIPITLHVSKNLLMITGVNAGGKTMLLKSVLSAIFCAKMLIPMKIHAVKSRIPLIHEIALIAQDPQDSRNDISTFSGRIQEIRQFLDKQSFIIGIDEIEIGTDTHEAASLYKVILERFLENKAKILVTTHHKHLASLMVDNPNTQLLAAMYDYKAARPLYTFIEGIGKSYAMECARHYGIPESLIQKAKELHGSEANRLEKLIEESHYQIAHNKQQEKKLHLLIQEQEQKNASLESARQQLKKQFESQSLLLKKHYNEAIKEVKMLIRQSQKDIQIFTQAQDSKAVQHTIANMHKLLNKTHKNQEKTPNIHIKMTMQYKVGDWVKHNNTLAKIISMNKNGYTLEMQNGVKLKGINPLHITSAKAPKNTESTYHLQADIQAQMKLDLHGFTKEEAIESLEDFLNHAIMARFGEVLIVHGMGSGILKKTIQDFLDSCNYIRGHVQAPQSMGGLGARIVYL